MEQILLTDDVLGSPLWRPLHDILIDWNEGRIKLEDQGLPDLVGKMAKGENNIKAVKQMVKVVSKAQLKKVVEWSNEPCPHTHNPNYFKPRKLCEDCWQALLKEIDG